MLKKPSHASVVPLKRSHLKMFCCVRAGSIAIKYLKIDYKISDQTDYESRIYCRTINWPRKNKEKNCFRRIKRIRLVAKKHEILSYFGNFEPEAEKF
jgi:hypothetical protein